MAISSWTTKRQQDHDEQEEILSRISAMRTQESQNYNFTRYCFLEGSNQEHNIDNLPEDLTDEPTDALCRTKMVDWCYSVVDHCEFSRSNVFIAVSNLDRYLATPAGQKALRSRREFQLACMTVIYTSIKINEVETFTPKGMARVSRGDYTAEEIEACELDMLLALKWHVNPPSTIAFVGQHIALLRLILQEPFHDTVSLQDHQNLMEHVIVNANFQIEMASRDYKFVGVEASKVALAAILNALASAEIEDFYGNNKEAITESLCAKLSIDFESIVPLCNDLLGIFSSSADQADDVVSTAAISHEDHTRDESFDSNTSFDDVAKTNAIVAANAKLVSPKSVKGPTTIHNKHPILGSLLCGILEPLGLLQDVEH
jgi:hypothetical protein